ncbi:MAG: methionine--tRNA ligase [Candidatus Doudnabacteria bacterium]|nr:methionine--tRNA ligase [Candidatus Doudnabacteria bacterium]
MDKFYITTPIYYVNDKPHIGSAYPTIAADVLARFYRAAGVPTFFLAGTAEHGTKIENSAKQAGKNIQEFVDENSAKFSLAWDILEISNDDFIRTTEDRHEQAVVSFFEKLKASGKVYEGEYEGLYCVGHESFVKEGDLVGGLCPDHKTKPERVKEKNWFFKLSDYTGILKSKIESGEFAIEPESRRNEILSFIAQGLEDIAISRQNVRWAIPLPWDKSQTIYVWLDELYNYVSAGGKNWPADLHIVGKDIIKFHCIIWPALLEAVGLPWPRKVFAHGFFTIDGQKISKTLGNAIDPVELAQKYGADAVRYFLLREIPFGQDGDFSIKKLEARYEGDLANGLGNLFSRLATLVAQNLAGKIPDIVESPKDLSAVDKLTQDLKFHEALARIWEQIAWANKYIDETKPWELVKKDPKLFAEVISSLAALLCEIALKLAPYLPETAEQIRSALSAEKIVKPEPLFPRFNVD